METGSVREKRGERGKWIKREPREPRENMTNMAGLHWKEKPGVWEWGRKVKAQTGEI